MSKTIILLVVLCSVAGFAITWFTGFNPVTTLTTFLADPAQFTLSLADMVMQRWEIVATGVGVLSAGFAIFVNTIKQVKTSHNDAENLLKGQLLEANQTTAKAEADLAAVQSRVSDQTARVSVLEAEKAELNNRITEQNNTIQKLQNDLSYGTDASKQWVKSEIEKATEVH